jgi:hypothetical protein
MPRVSDQPPDLLETAVRAFTLRTTQAGPHEVDEDAKLSAGPARLGGYRPRWREALVWDTETVTTPDQRLLVLCWRLYRIEDGHPHRCLEEGLAYPDDLPTRDPDGYAALIQYRADHPDADLAPGLGRMGGGPTLRLEPLSWWLQRRMYLRGYEHRDRCDIVGLNLLFDFGRIAQHWRPARGEYYGGWSLGLWGAYDADGEWIRTPYRPRLRARAIDPRRTLFEWGSTGDDEDAWKGRGRFVDLRTLAFALTDRGHTLESACHAFDVPYSKADVDLGRITPELLHYAGEDVRATSRLYFACLDELARHEGIQLDAHRLYSPATIGTRYLEAMGYQRPLEQFTNLTFEQLGWATLPKKRRALRRKAVRESPKIGAVTPALLGWAMSAFYGGRAEARIVRAPVPVALVDFTSMYPSVNALLNTRSLLTAEQIRVEDATEEVRTMLDREGLVEWCLTPQAWREIGVTLVEIEPRGAVLPVRAKYDPTTGDYGIGVNPYTYDGHVWYALPDVIAASILTPDDAEESLRVVRAVRLVGEGIQPSLGSVALRGGRRLDPRRDDPFLAMIEERHLVRDDDPRQERFLKVTANSTSYGVLARFDRRERATPTPVTVYGPDGDPYEQPVRAPEDPGPYCFPPIAASITAAARLMLALLEHEVTSAGGTYAFCDTDSLAIVATPHRRRISVGGGQVTALSWAAVRRIRDRFTPLNPYDREVIAGSPWSVKFDSLTRELWCYAISAKRYALYHLQKDSPELVGVRDQADEDTSPGEDAQDDQYVDWSEHGLGLYLDPTATDPDQSPRDPKGRRLWVKAAWEWILRDAHGNQPPLPTWAEHFAVTRFTLSGPRTAEWFDGYNHERPRDEWVRAGSFGLIAHPAVGFHGQPAAPYERDPSQWPALGWYDRATGQPIKVAATARLRGEAADLLASGTVPVQTIGEVIHRYRLRPEYKSLAPTGEPTHRDTVGALTRRPVESTPALQTLSGKEGNKLLERLTGEVTDPADYRNDYGRRDDEWQLVLAGIDRVGSASVARRAGVHRRTIERLRGGATPRPSTRFKVTRAVADEIVGRSADVSRSSLASIAERVATGPRICECGCGRPLPHRRRRWYEDACRQRARRGS